MKVEDFREWLTSMGADPERFKDDQEIIDAFRSVGHLAASMAGAVNYPPLNVLAGFILEFAKIFEATGEKGHTIQAGGFEELVAKAHHGEYLAEKFTRLIAPLMIQNQMFTIAFMETSGWGPLQLGLMHYEALENERDSAVVTSRFLQEEIDRLLPAQEELDRERAERSEEDEKYEAEINRIITDLRAKEDRIKEQELELEKRSKGVLHDEIVGLRNALRHEKEDNTALKAQVEKLEARIEHLQKYVKEVEW